MMELHYAFIKNNRVEQVAVFESQDENLANSIVSEFGFDDAIWVAENKPAMWSTYENGVFVEPTQEYLIESGILLITQNDETLIDATLPEENNVSE